MSNPELKLIDLCDEVTSCKRALGVVIDDVKIGEPTTLLQCIYEKLDRVTDEMTQILKKNFEEEKG